MRAGFFETDITPSPGMERPATYHKLFIKEINDPLKVRAAVFDNGETTVALVGIDAPIMPRQTFLKIKAQLPDIQIICGASHTHYGGPLWNELPGIDNAPELIRKLALEESICLDHNYEQLVVEQTLSAIKTAQERLEEVELSFGSGNAEGISFNRRFQMKNGKTSTHPGKGNNQIQKPAGPVDSSVGIIGVWRPNGKLVGCVVNFSCHATCDGTGVTADYPGYLVKTVRAVMGEDCGVVFLNGACGDVTQIDNLSLRPLESGPEWSEKLGTVISAEAIKLLMTSARGAVSSLKVLSDTVAIPRRRPSAESLARSLKVVNQWKRDIEFHLAKERLLLDYIIKSNPVQEVEISTVQIGPLVICAMPVELFAILGLNIKSGSHFPFTWVVTLSNGHYGYIPDIDAFDPQTGGGYETLLTLSTSFVPQAGNILAAKALENIKSLTPENVPTGIQITPTNKIWDFGNAGPETE